MELEINTPYDIGETVYSSPFNKNGIIIKIKLDDKYRNELEYLLEHDDGARTWYSGMNLSKI